MLRGLAMKHRWAKPLRVALSVGGTLLLLAWVGSRVDHQQLKALFTGASWGWFVAAALLIPLQIYLAAWRWGRISNDLSMPMSKRHAISEYGLSILLNQVLPGGITGDAVRVWRHRTGHGTFGGPLKAAVVDRAIGQMAQVAVTAFGLCLWVWIHPEAPPSLAWVVVGVMTGFFVVMWYRPIPGLRSLVDDAHEALRGWNRKAKHAIISTTLVGLFLLCFWCCAQALQLPLGIKAITAVPLLMLVLILPFSVGGWGLREVSAAAVLGALGWTTEQSVALSAAYGLVNLAGASPAAFVLLRNTGGRE